MANKTYENRTSAQAETMPEMPEEVNINRVTTYEVYDGTDNQIGSTSAIWMDRYNQPAFIGIKTTRLFGRTHVIPAWGAEVNHGAQRIPVPCPKDVIDNAPSFSPDEELDLEKERQIMDYFRGQGACQPTARGAAPERSTSDAGATETVVPLHEEEVKVGKRTVEAGGVRLRKVIRTETVQRPVQLQREEIQVERVPASETHGSEKAFEGEDLYIPLRREEAVVEKETRVREGVRVRKTSDTEEQTVAGEVRKEDVEIEREDKRKAA
jgi:uncharacterized protein (TIGR02271 family)